MFRSRDLAAWFARFPWYDARHAEVRLSEVEQAHVATIQAEEARRR